ncbi:hypothetical protein AB0D65_29165 [Streptomyces griseoloalbus]|uniref:Uncharacterized protein n=1 Tax=Streptomyces griseoloalbus TaxID=67303 RepID=A0ABV3EFK8_9ACTN
MSDRAYPPESTHELWLPTLDFVQSRATVAWAYMMDQGVRFVMPQHVAAMPRLEDRAAALADAERERLATADLYHFSTEACEATDAVELRHQALEQLLPSASGFLVWERPPMHLRSGIPIRAASWGVAYDGGTWVSWWSDTQVAVDLGLCSYDALLGSGPLTFHEEVHLPPQAWPVQAGDPASPEYGIFRGLFSAWTAIDTGAVEEKQRPALPRWRKAARREFALEAPPVRCFTPSVSGGTTTSPQTIVRRTLAGLLLDRPYPGELPAELAPWHCYTKDGGHSLLVLLAPVEEGFKTSAGGPARIEDACVPVPVKAVLRAGWRVGDDGYVRTAVPYDPDLGVVTDPEDDEF